MKGCIAADLSVMETNAYVLAYEGLSDRDQLDMDWMLIHQIDI